MERFKIIIGAGLVGAAVLALVFWLYNRGATPRFEGKVSDVRTLGMDQSSSVAVVNFAAINASNRLIVVAQREVEITDEKGNYKRGQVISTDDMNYLFQLYPTLGGLRDEPFLDRARIEPGKEIRAAFAARFEIPKHELDARQDIRVIVTDVDGAKTVIRENQTEAEEKK